MEEVNRNLPSVLCQIDSIFPFDSMNNTEHLFIYNHCNVPKQNEFEERYCTSWGKSCTSTTAFWGKNKFSSHKLENAYICILITEK